MRRSWANRVTAMMVVRNEAGRYLRQVLDDLTAWVDDIVILDDASDDSTPDLCRSYDKVIRFERNPSPLFMEHEGRLRARLWNMVESVCPDWILAIDADEMFETRIRDEIRALINQSSYDAVEFRLFDFWGSLEYYRVDGEWNPWSRFVRLLVRYVPGKPCTWPDLPIHCGRWPLEYRGPLLTFHSDIRVKHLGWVRLEDHRTKYEFYRAKEIALHGAPSKHTESILAPPDEVKLEKWVDSKSLSYQLPWYPDNSGDSLGRDKVSQEVTGMSRDGAFTIQTVRFRARAKRRVGILTTNHFSPDGNRVVYGGAERYGIELTKLLLDMGFDVEWWQAGSGWQRELLPGVVVHSIPEGDVQFQTAPRLNHTFHERATGIDCAIYFVTFLAYPYAMERSISISHGIYWDYPTFESILGSREGRHEWKRRLFLALSAVRKVVSVDTATIHWINATWPGLYEKLAYIPNFVDLPFYDMLPDPEPHDQVRIIFPRRLTSVRGVNEAARVAEILSAEYDNVEFHFVGRAHDDILENHMIRWASDNPKIYYYWRPPHLMPWTYKNMDIALVPSKSTEGTSLSCLEAMGAGCAIIASYTGGLSDLIIDGYNGRLIKPTFSKLVETLAELIENREERIRLGKAAHDVALAFTFDVWRRRWMKEIREVFN